jgi:hypothetical protein
MPQEEKLQTTATRVSFKPHALANLRKRGKQCVMCVSLSTEDAHRCPTCKGSRIAALTQSEVQAMCKIPTGLLTAYEHCVCKAPLSSAQRLAEYYNIPLSEILTDESMLGLNAAHHQIADALGITAEADQ